MSIQSPEIVLLPGMDGTGRLFKPLLQYLQKSGFPARIVSLSDRSLGTYAELLIHLEHELCSSTSYVLIAESFSTPLAITYAAAQPPGLVGLVLCAGFASTPRTGPVAALVRLLSPLLFRLPLSKFIVRTFLTGPEASQELVTQVISAVSSVAPAVLSARLRSVLTSDAGKLVSSIRVPLLYLAATRDRLVGSTAADEILQSQSGAKLVRIDSAHLVLQAHPQEASEAIVAFSHACLDNVKL